MSNTHDIFRYRGLGKAAGEVWEILQENPVTIEVLAERTGRHVKTIKRVLGRMAKIIDTMTGEVLAMASTGDGVTYYALPVDLDHIARIIGTAGAGQRQRESHAKERRLHARGLSLGKTG